MKRILCLLSFMVLSVFADAQDQPPKWVTEGPYIAGHPALIEVPYSSRVKSLFVDPNASQSLKGIQPCLQHSGLNIDKT